MQEQINVAVLQINFTKKAVSPHMLNSALQCCQSVTLFLKSSSWSVHERAEDGNQARAICNKQGWRLTAVPEQLNFTELIFICPGAMEMFFFKSQ